MLKFLKWLFILLVVAIIGLGIWSYAPDIEPSELQAQYGGPPSRFIELPNGQSVHIRDEGPRDAPAILLIHGSNASLHTWQGWADDLKRDYRVVRYDQPGHGLTGAQINRDYSTEAFRDTGAEVMNALGINRYVVAGNSMGGWVAWNIALKYPQRVAGLALVDASARPRPSRPASPSGFNWHKAPQCDRSSRSSPPAASSSRACSRASAILQRSHPKWSISTGGCCAIRAIARRPSRAAISRASLRRPSNLPG